jgi:hypothetical protein
LIRQLAEEGVVDGYEVAAGRKHWEWLDHWRQTCETRYAVFVDSDVQFLRLGWLRDLIRSAERSKWALTSGELVPEQPDSLHAGTVLFRFAERLAPWLIAVDIAMCDVSHVSFRDWSHESREVHEGRIAYDVAGTLYHTLCLDGVPCGSLPPDYEQTFRHYGGLSWNASGRGRKWIRVVAQSASLNARLRKERWRRSG